MFFELNLNFWSYNLSSVKWRADKKLNCSGTELSLPENLKKQVAAEKN